LLSRYYIYFTLLRGGGGGLLPLNSRPRLRSRAMTTTT
jgi:hypothetical protein